jgi:hypothetical protein
MEKYIKGFRNRIKLKKMKIEKMFITPKMAVELLVRNTNNRKVRIRIVDKYASDILSGKWVYDSADLMRFSEDGTLLDGQHRLMAVIKANMPIYAYVAKGMDSKAMETIDTGASRSMADIFQLSGIKNASNVAGSLKLANDLMMSGTKVRGATAVKSSKFYLDWYNESPAFFDDTITESRKLYRDFQGILSPTQIGGYIIALSSKEDIHIVVEFMRQICQGTDITNGTIIKLRNLLIKDKVDRKNRLSDNYKKAIILKTWKAFISGRELKVLKYDLDLEGHLEI